VTSVTTTFARDVTEQIGYTNEKKKNKNEKLQIKRKKHEDTLVYDCSDCSDDDG